MIWLRWQTFVDFGVLASALYLLLVWAKQTRTLRLAIAIILLHAAGLVTRRFGLPVTSYVLTGTSIGALAMIVILFPGELRHAFLRLDSLLRLGLARRLPGGTVFQQLAGAAFELAATRTGALIVVPGKYSIDEVVRGGIRFGATASKTVIEAIFEKHSPLHDGAAILTGDTLSRVGTVLPLSERLDLPEFFGTRHRAAMGLAERSDAAMVVVSEERGVVTVMHDRNAIETPTEEALVRLLERLSAQPKANWRQRLSNLATHNLQVKGAAVGLAAMIWLTTLARTSGAVRTVTVPIEFRSVPVKMEIVHQSARTIDVQLRGAPLLMDSFNGREISVHFDLSRTGQGEHTLRVLPESVTPPPGMSVDRVYPESITVELEPRR